MQKLRQQSFQMSGPQLWNSLPKSVRNLKTNNLDDFKQILDEYLCKVPDESKCDGLNPGAANVPGLVVLLNCKSCFIVVLSNLKLKNLVLKEGKAFSLRYRPHLHAFQSTCQASRPAGTQDSIVAALTHDQVSVKM